MSETIYEYFGLVKFEDGVDKLLANWEEMPEIAEMSKKLNYISLGKEDLTTIKFNYVQPYRGGDEVIESLEKYFEKEGAAYLIYGKSMLLMSCAETYCEYPTSKLFTDDQAIVKTPEYLKSLKRINKHFASVELQILKADVSYILDNEDSSIAEQFDDLSERKFLKLLQEIGLDDNPEEIAEAVLARMQS